MTKSDQELRMCFFFLFFFQLIIIVIKIEEDLYSALCQASRRLTQNKNTTSHHQRGTRNLYIDVTLQCYSTFNWLYLILDIEMTLFPQPCS